MILIIFKQNLYCFEIIVPNKKLLVLISDLLYSIMSNSFSFDHIE